MADELKPLSEEELQEIDDVSGLGAEVRRLRELVQLGAAAAEASAWGAERDGESVCPVCFKYKYQDETATGLDRHAETCFIRRFLAKANPDLRRNA